MPHMGCHLSRYPRSKLPRQSCLGPGVVATEAETRKRHKYSTVDDSMCIFQSIAIETLGAFGMSAIDFFNDFGRRMRAASQDTRAGMFLMQ